MLGRMCVSIATLQMMPELEANDTTCAGGVRPIQMPRCHSVSCDDGSVSPQRCATLKVATPPAHDLERSPRAQRTMLRERLRFETRHTPRDDARDRHALHMRSNDCVERPATLLAV
jgi:hypothetical protein